MVDPYRKLRALIDRVTTAWVVANLRNHGAVIGQDVSFIGIPIISIAPSSSLSIGERCTLISRAKDTALGTSHAVVLRTLRNGATLCIGKDTGLSGATICAAEEVRIGSGVLVGADVMIADTDFHPLYTNRRRAPPEDAMRAPIHIHDDVFVGARSMILKGVTIGRGAVIGAGSVVSKSVPEMVIAAGNPARVIGDVPGRESP